MVRKCSADDGQRAVRVFAYWLVSFGTLGMHYAFGTVYVQILDGLGGTREIGALVGSLGTGMMDGNGLLSGRIVQRFGSRRCALAGGCLTALGWCLSSLVTQTWHLLFSWSILVGFGHSLALFGAVALMNEWFSKRLALAHACANTGGAAAPFLCGLFVPPLFDGVGWRRAFLVLGGINGTLLLLAGCLLTPPVAQEPPRPSQQQAQEEEGAPTAEATSATGATASRPQVGVCELLHSRRFQLLAAAYLGFGLGSWVAVVHLVRMAMDGGMVEAEAARLLLFLSLGSVLLRLPGAWLADRLGRRLITSLACAVLCAMHLACVFDASRGSSAFLSAFSFCVGGFNGIVLSSCPSVPAEVLPPAYRSLASSAMLSPIGIGFLAGPPVASAIQVATGSYAVAMVFASACLGLSAALMGGVACMTPDAVGKGGVRTVATPAVEATITRA